jgi:hypothetical protein
MSPSTAITVLDDPFTVPAGMPLGVALLSVP